MANEKVNLDKSVYIMLILKRINLSSHQFQGILILTILKVKYLGIRNRLERPSPSIKKKISQQLITFTLPSN